MPIIDTTQIFPRTAANIRRVIQAKHPGKVIEIHMQAGGDVVYSVKWEGMKLTYTDGKKEYPTPGLALLGSLFRRERMRRALPRIEGNMKYWHYE